MALSLSEKEERKIEEGRSFHILESRNLVPFPQHPHDSSRKDSLKVTSLGGTTVQSGHDGEN